MEPSPYLQALQRISGLTPSEKRQTLTKMAQEKIKKWNNMQTSLEVTPSKRLLEPLVPWVKLEIGRILKRPDYIIVGLSSDDQTIFYQALKVKWFFKGVGTVGYPDDIFFKDHIFPNISLRNRNKIIKVLAANLTEPIIAELFYVTTSELYGLNQARPFLKNCSELFILNCINTHKVRLTLKEMIYFYSKFPSLIIQYLYRQNDDEFKYESRSTSNSRYISRTKVNLRKFLPRLLKNHPADFSKLVQKYGTLEILLKNYKTYLFLKQELETLLNNPRLYFPMLSLKKATFLLSKNEFMIVLQEFFPVEITDFKFMDIYNLLEFMPQKKKLSILLTTFRKTYSYELDDFHRFVASAMKYFPLEERHHQARRLMYDDYNWLIQSQTDMTRSWRCYLPLEESLPMILNDLKKCKSSLEEVYLLQQLIFSCGANDDFEAMLDILKYISINYTNRENSTSVKIFDQITRDFDLTPHIPLYWEELYEFIFRSNIKTGIHDSIENIWAIIVWGIRMDLERNQDIHEKIILLTEINRRNRVRPIWNILKDIAFFEKICLDKFMQAIFFIYIIQQVHNTDLWKNAVVSLVSAMYDFNHRYASRYNSFFERFFVTHCIWLENAVNKLLSDYFDKTSDFECKELITLLKENESVVLEAFLDKEDLCNIPRAIIILKKDIQSITENWEMYFKSCKRKITKKSSQMFLRHIKWSHSLPCLFVQKCLREIEKSFDKRTIKILAILMEGSIFENFIKVFIEKILAKIAQQKPESHSKIMRMYHLLLEIAEAIKYMNIPFSSACVEQLCKSGCMPIILECLTGLERQVPVNVLIPFVECLLSIFDAVAKHAVRIFQSAANSNDLQRLLLTLWKNPNNEVKTRTYLIKNIHHAFTVRPTDSIWKMMLLCLNDLNSKDEADALDIIACYRTISNQYIPNYIRNILSVFTNIEAQSKVSGVPPVWCYIPDIIGSLSVSTSNLFPEILHELILEHWFSNASVNKKVMKNSINYFVNCYIRPSRSSMLVYRLQFFSRIFREMLTDYLQKLDNNNETLNFIFVNTFLHKFTKCVIFEMPFNETKYMLVNAALESFLTVLTPQHHMEFYCYLKLTDLFNQQISPQQLAEKIDGILLTLIENFSTSCFYLISNYLYNVIKLFYCNESLLLDVVEHLIKHEKRNNTYLATCLLVNMTIYSEENYERYWQILTHLKQHTDSLIVATANLAANTKLM